MKLVLVASVLMAISWASGSRPICYAAPAPEVEPGIVVRVFDDAQLDPRAIDLLISQSEAVLRSAGVISQWVNCSRIHSSQIAQTCASGPPTHLSLRVLPRRMKGNDRALGYSAAGPEGGTYGGLFYPTVKASAEAAGVPVSTLLILAALHEFGHLLLGPDTHYPWGVMRAVLDRKAIREIVTVGPVFTRSQTSSIAAAIAKRVRASTGDCGCLHRPDGAR
jgi:hypothetical protein